jgi:hypothetical protein
MKLVLSAARGVLGLFVDDGALAIGVLGLVAAGAALAAFKILEPDSLGFALLAGLAALLVENVLRSGRRAPAAQSRDVSRK